MADLEKRLAREHESLKELESKSDLIQIVAIEGDPPRKYRVTFKCKGLMLHLVNKKPCLTANHVMEIDLPAGIPGYPNEAPYVRCLTPHFHPNISMENNMVCLGIERAWDSSLDIAWLVSHLADMITYRIYGIEEPYNLEATKWAEDNKTKLPLEDTPIFEEEAAITTHIVTAEEPAIAFEEPVETAKAATAIKAKKPEKKRTAKRATRKTSKRKASTKKQ